MRANRHVVRVGLIVTLLWTCLSLPLPPGEATGSAPRAHTRVADAGEAFPVVQPQARLVMPLPPATEVPPLDWQGLNAEAQRPTVLDLQQVRLAIPATSAPEAAHALRAAITRTVTSASDAGPGTLRDALGNASPGDVIVFDPAVFPPQSPQTITLQTQLPGIWESDLTLEASQAGVILDGTHVEDFTAGLRIDGAARVTLRGLQIQHFRYGIVLRVGANHCTIGGKRAVGAWPTGQGNVLGGNRQAGLVLMDTGTTDNAILGNLIGTDPLGDSAHANPTGVLVMSGASNNVIGGAHTPGVCDGPCNLVSGNLNEGMVLQESGTDGNRVVGNFVGTNLSGNRALPNGHGVAMGLASHIQIGGAAPGEGNLISGNRNYGIWISWEATTGILVLGNAIGTDISGTSSLPNYDGVFITQSHDNRVGGTAPGAGNLVSGNQMAGIWVQADTASGNTILGNRVGTDAGGTRALPNYVGIMVALAAAGNTIGGTTSEAGNLVSGNTDLGIRIERAGASNAIQGNLIGTDSAGQLALPNGAGGILVMSGSITTTIGGSTPGAGNLVSGNRGPGIQIQNQESSGNQVLGNRIGTNREGERTIANTGIGVFVVESLDTIVGGAHTPWVCEGPCNLISGNGSQGVVLQGPDSSPASKQGNALLGNFIGTDLAGEGALPNADGGVVLGSGAVGNRVGGSAMGEGNLIAGNRAPGVYLQGSKTTDNQVVGNRIGVVADGSAALPNGRAGVVILGGAHGNTVGGRGFGAGNLISGHDLSDADMGIQIQSVSGPGVQDNQVLGNLIGTNADGTAALPNSGGVAIFEGPTNTLVEDNVISGNIHNGVELDGASTQSNVIRDNAIGISADGRSALGNASGILTSGANHNTIGDRNVIAHNRIYGIALRGTGPFANTITQNAIYANGIDEIVYPDVSIPTSPPALTSWHGTTITGSACPGCRVEVFANATARPQGQAYLGSVTAGTDGDFTFAPGPGHLYISATATDLEGTTSPFCAGLLVGYVGYLPLLVTSGDGTFPLTPTPTATRTATGTATVTATHTPLSAETFTPSPTATPGSTPRGIYGKIFYNGVGIVNIYLDVLLCAGSQCFVQAATVTGAGGEYAFHSLPSLESGQFYYVRYRNGSGGNPANPNYLSLWFGPDINAYSAGSELAGGDAELADVGLVAPGDGASVTLPATFSWTRRSVTSDYYRLVFYDSARGAKGATGLLGYVDHATIGALPAGWPSGGRYQWWIRVYTAGVTDSYGESYGSRSITISYGSPETNSAMGLAIVVASQQDRTLQHGEVK